MVKDAITNLNGKASYSEIKEFILNKYGDVNESTITCQIIECSVNHPSRIHYPNSKKPRIANSAHDILFTVGRGKVELYNPDEHGIWEIRKNEYGKLIVAQSGLIECNIEGESEASNSEDDQLLFPVESHLRDFIAQNIGIIKINNHKLKLFIDENGRDGIEYPTEVGPIDILALDEDGNYVVFELKLSRGVDRAMGQISRYMGWIKKKMAGTKKVHGIIVAKNVDEKLKYAASIIPEIALFEYELNFKIGEVKID
jgi:hypothetical protein